MTRLARPRQVRAAARPTGPLQRDRAIAHCERALDDPAGGLLVFEAPPGGGKTAMLEAACNLAEARGFRVLRATASPFERDLHYGVARQLLEPAGGVEEVLAGAAPDDPSVPDALQRLLGVLGSRKPVVLAIDDFAFGDDPSLRFLRYLVQRRRSNPVLTLATLSPVRPGRAPISVVAIEQAALVVSLEPLEEASVAELLAGAGGTASPAEVTSLTGGNPFLVQSLIRNAGPGVPPEVTRDLELRFARLPAEAELLARAAAVLGEGASVAIAARVMEASPSAALDAVDDLVDANVLERSGLIRFAAPLVREAVYEMLAGGERSRLHRLAARALWDTGAPARVAAEHLLRSDGTGENWAIELLAGAAREADSAGEAISCLRRALLEDPFPAERARLLAELAAAELSAGGAEAARHLSQAVDLLPPGIDRAEACDELGRVLWGLGRYSEAAQAFGEGLEGAEEVGGRVVARLNAGRLAAGRVLGDGEQRVGGGGDSTEPAMQAQLGLELTLAGGPLRASCRARPACAGRRAAAPADRGRARLPSGVCALL